MRKIFLLAVIVLLACTACGKDQIINYDQLPANAKNTIEKYFDKNNVAYVKKDGIGDWVEYEVKFLNQDEVDFNSNGDVKSVDMKSGAVPSDLVPQQIRDFVANNYSPQTIVQYEVTYRGYEIELSSGLEIEFDKQCNVTNLD